MEKFRLYFVGTVIQIVKPGLIVVEVIESNGPYSGKYCIESKCKLNIGDIVKIKFKYTPFHDGVITAVSPQSFSTQDYYVKKIR